MMAVVVTRPRVLIVAHSSEARDCHLWARVMAVDTTAHLLLRGDALPRWASDDTLAGRVHLLPTRSLGSETSSWMPGLGRLLADVRPDLIHADAEAWSFTVQWLVRSGFPVVAHGAENVITHAPWINRRRRAGLRHVLQRLRGYAAWGRTGLDAVREAGLPDRTPTAVVPARPPSPRSFPHAETRPTDGPLRVAAVGRLERAKGFDVVIDAARLASATGPIRLSFMGNGAEQSRLMRQAADAGIPAEFHAHGGDVQVGRLMADCDVIVVPSRRTATWTEQWCRVAAEGLLTGRPVFAAATGELPETVGVRDWLFQEDDASRLAALLESIRPLSERKIAAARALEQSRRFDIDDQAQRIVDLWTQARRRTAS
jgi:glycosyltransferase involved in cell wall biosynthesis